MGCQEINESCPENTSSDLMTFSARGADMETKTLVGSENLLTEGYKIKVLRPSL